MSTAEIVWVVVFLVCSLFLIPGAVGFLIFDGWRGTITMWILMVCVLSGVAAAVYICYLLGIGPMVKR